MKLIVDMLSVSRHAHVSKPGYHFIPGYYTGRYIVLLRDSFKINAGPIKDYAKMIHSRHREFEGHFNTYQTTRIQNEHIDISGHYIDWKDVINFCNFYQMDDIKELLESWRITCNQPKPGLQLNQPSHTTGSSSSQPKRGRQSYSLSPDHSSSSSRKPFTKRTQLSNSQSLKPQDIFSGGDLTQEEIEDLDRQIEDEICGNTR